MSASQIRAAEVLLRKVWPDLKAVEAVVETKPEPTREEIEARLRAHGIDPKTAFRSFPI